MCNAFEKDIQFAPSDDDENDPVPSFLPVALTKMDHSANEALDAIKRTRLSDPTSEGNCTDEIIVTRNRMIELQVIKSLCS